METKRGTKIISTVDVAEPPTGKAKIKKRVDKKEAFLLFVIVLVSKKAPINIRKLVMKYKTVKLVKKLVLSTLIRNK